MADKVRVAVIGAGVISRAHLRGYKANPDTCEVVAICDLNRERADERKAEFDLPEAVYDADAVWGRDDVDAVSVCLPHDLHEPFVIRAAEAKKHVLCEKPYALSVASLDRMVAACDSAGVVNMSAQVLRFRDPLRAAREFIREGHLGTIHQTWRRRAGITRSLDINPWIYNYKTGGSLTVHGFGAHEYDMLMWLQSATCDTVYAQSAANNPIWNAADEVSAIFRLSDGSFANMRQSLNTLDGGWDEYIMGEKGCLHVGGAGFKFKPYDGEEQMHEVALDETGGFKGECGEFVSAIVEGREPEASAKQARWVQAVMESVERSSERNQVIDVRAEFGGEFGPISVS